MQDLVSQLQLLGPLAIAVSGGIDSLTLATVAHVQAPGSTMFHALSPAVPTQATERVRHYTKLFGWQLQIIDAGEMRDASYRANPIDRCYFCKHNLYRSIAEYTRLPIASGTNLDDLADFRPGLKAATEQAVVHPFVQAGITKDNIRSLAALVGLEAIADLPASPCLASRVSTGIGIEPQLLTLIDKIETAIRQQFVAVCEPVNLRCRVLTDGLRIQSDYPLLEHQQAIQALIAAILAGSRFSNLGNTIRIEPYVQGSAFIRIRQ